MITDPTQNVRRSLKDIVSTLPRSSKILLAASALFSCVGFCGAALLLAGSNSSQPVDGIAGSMTSIGFLLAQLSFLLVSLPPKPNNPDQLAQWKDEHAQQLILRPILFAIFAALLVFEFIRLYQ